MKSSLSRITSVTRWLLVVVGCAVLASAQPMSAAEPSPAPLNDQTILYPGGRPEAKEANRPAETETPNNPWLALTAVLLCLGGVWVWVQRRRGFATPFGKANQKLAVEESKSLGNRQFLVVAAYGERKFLLGITPERIQLLSEVTTAPQTED